MTLAANGGVLTMRIQRILGLTKGPVFPQSAAVILGVRVATEQKTYIRNAV